MAKIFKFICILLAFTVISNADKHPVNQHIVDEIRSKTDEWIPMEVEENPFSYMPTEQLTSMLGATKL